ncbi:CPBP family intramembrane metalloprotease [Candidatus Pacearchaeota archaeon]|nr:CPBP family intramembrane metalloprotease [Candidatus Pacearchaeota archaeon]
MLKEVLIILILFILPFLLIYNKLIPKKYYLVALFTVLIFTLILVFVENVSPKDLGIRIDNFKQTYLPHLIFTFISLVVLLIFIKYNGSIPIKEWWLDRHFRYFFVIISFTQVFLFLGYFLPKLQVIFPSIWIAILVNGIMFASVHIFYKDFVAMFPLLILGGVGFAAIYAFYPNLILAGISHSILNFFIVLYGYLSVLK